MRLGATEPDGQRTIVLSGMLGTVHIPGREIENIAFTILPFPDAEDSPQDG